MSVEYRKTYVWVLLLENKTSKEPQQSPPPMGNRNRPIVPSTVPAGPIARRGGAA